jgi:tRNA (guanine26-N2/guanine27-N2)-dimethyltransferase
MQGHGIEPLLSFSDGRTFRTAVRLRRRPAAGEERRLGLLAHCHRCGDQQVVSLLRLGRWQPCACGPTPPERVASLAVSGPLWIGPLQQPELLAAMAALAGAAEASIAPASLRRLQRLQADPGALPRCWSMAEIGRRLGAGPPPLEAVVGALRERGHRASASGVMAGLLRSDAPWPLILASAASLAGRAAR